MAAETVLKACTGVAVRLDCGQRLRITNTHGSQVVDCWALNAGDPAEHLSMRHCRNLWYRLAPRVGDLLVTNLRNPVLRLAEDTSPGIHDTLFPCCDLKRYRQLGVEGYHASCAENFATALTALGVTPPAPPAPLNLFMNIPIMANGALTVAPPASRPGDHVTLEAQMPCVVVLSACPHDILPVNGVGNTPRDVAFAVLPAA